MPESHKAERRRVQKANREQGIGDEEGRIFRQKEAPKMSNCTVCKQVMKITKTNTELTAHSEGKHGKTLDECFPGAKDVAADLLKSSSAKGLRGAGGPSVTKAQKKKKDAAGMDDMLSAGLGGGPGKKKGGKKYR
mmetsp:Transcript_4679/g.6533  ORF Transcript_4679/g.6533 Transcript_4679/m.6533 type:complete len:135 (-) Transcript_4679:210-614(-)